MTVATLESGRLHPITLPFPAAILNQESIIDNLSIEMKIPWFAI
jgi:hypothetical protein